MADRGWESLAVARGDSRCAGVSRGDGGGSDSGVISEVGVENTQRLRKGATLDSCSGCRQERLEALPLVAGVEDDLNGYGSRCAGLLGRVAGLQDG